jgi:hypothetical protein
LASLVVTTKKKKKKKTGNIMSGWKI